MYYNELGETRTARALKVQKYRSDMLDVSFLETCHESREVFIERFHKTLPTIKDGLMRFDDQTTIWFENLLSQDFLSALEANLKGANPAENYQLPGWFSTIKKAAVTGHVGDPLLRRWQEIWVLLFNFTALKSFKLDISIFGGHNRNSMAQKTGARLANIARLVTEINEWAEGHPEYSVPDIGIFQRT